MQRASVEPGAGAGERGVGLTGQRQVNRCEHRLVVAYERGGHRPLRQGVQVVDVAFGRIQDPPFAGGQGAARELVLDEAGVRAQEGEAGAQDIESRVVVGGERAHQLFAGPVADHVAEPLPQRRSRRPHGHRGLREQVGVGRGTGGGSALDALHRLGHGSAPIREGGTRWTGRGLGSYRPACAHISKVGGPTVNYKCM